MNETILPFLIAVTVILLIWGTYQVLGGLSDERKKIQERLSGEGKATEGFDPATLTVVRRRAEDRRLVRNSGASAASGRNGPEDRPGLAEVLAGEVRLRHAWDWR